MARWVSVGVLLSAAALCPSSLAFQPARRLSDPAMITVLSAEQGEEDAAELFSRRRQVDETLPVECWETTPPRNIIGVFQLPKLLANGDVLRAKDSLYVIKRVASLYKYTGGKFELYKKRADATEASRAALENRLTELLPPSSSSSESSS